VESTTSRRPLDRNAPYRNPARLAPLAGAPPPLPRLRWSYEQRARMFGALNPRYVHRRGTARRWRRELKTQRALDWRRDLLAGGELLLQRDRLHRPWRELMYSRHRGRAPAVWDLRAKIRRRLDLVVRHGPASGWGVQDPGFELAPGHSYVRYVVPKASEKCWRWWIALSRELRQLVLLLDRLWDVLVPPHQQEQVKAETVRTERSSVRSSLLQDRSPGISSVGDLLRPLLLRQAM